MRSLNAESIAFALDKGRRIRADEYKACCPAHDDASPSLSISQKADRVLLKCWSGCAQRDIIDALRSRDLWPRERERAFDPLRPVFSSDEVTYFRHYCVHYRDAVRAGCFPGTAEDRKFLAFSTILSRMGISA